jgi:hypothetical protein
MPRSNRERASKILFKPFDAEKEDSSKNASTSPIRSRGVRSVKSAIPTHRDLNRPKQPSLPQKVLSSGFEEVRLVNGVPSKSTINVFSGKSPLKSQEASRIKLPACDPSFLSKKESGSDLVNGALLRKEHASSRFLSVLVGRGRMVRHKTVQPAGQGFSWHSKETKRLTYAKRVQLFQALSKKPLSVLDLHVHFGVTKQTIKRLIKNGFLKEVWGSKAIGVRFKLTNRGESHLKELVTTARHDSRITGKNQIRLKTRI